MSFGDGFGETLAFENLQQPYILKIDCDFFLLNIFDSNF